MVKCSVQLVEMIYTGDPTWVLIYGNSYVNKLKLILSATSSWVIISLIFRIQSWSHFATAPNLEGCPKLTVLPENTDAVRELILPDHHVIYRKEAYWGLVPLTYFKYCIDIRPSKRFVRVVYRMIWKLFNAVDAVLIGTKKWWNISIAVLLKDMCKIVTNDESWSYAYETETKQQ